MVVSTIASASVDYPLVFAAGDSRIRADSHHRADHPGPPGEADAVSASPRPTPLCRPQLPRHPPRLSERWSGIVRGIRRRRCGFVDRDLLVPVPTRFGVGSARVPRSGNVPDTGGTKATSRGALSVAAGTGCHRVSFDPAPVEHGTVESSRQADRRGAPSASPGGVHDSPTSRCGRPGTGPCAISANWPATLS